ncbi:MAG: hypothetical protein GY847_14425 [Proteobacteria bacterium]|nr:hypothetical protein [Pseudomonadota bacterium]
MGYTADIKNLLAEIERLKGIMRGVDDATRKFGCEDCCYRGCDHTEDQKEFEGSCPFDELKEAIKEGP